MESKYQSLSLTLKPPSSNSLSKPSLEKTLETTLETKLALENICNRRIKYSQTIKSTNPLFSKMENCKYIKYTPSNSNNSKIIEIRNRPIDPLSSNNYTFQKIPHSNTDPSIFVPVMHSPERKITYQDQRDWKVPPCVSISKNPKGLVIPLDIRLANDGRNLKEFQVNKNFSKFADVLFLAEKRARAEIEERNRISESIQIKAELKKEEELREAAKQARLERKAINSGTALSNIESVNTVRSDLTEELLLGKKSEREELVREKNERNQLRALRKKEIENDRKVEMIVNKKKKFKDNDKNIFNGNDNNNNRLFDEKLFEKNNENNDADVYDKPLFNEEKNLNAIYKDDDGLNHKKVIKKLVEKGGKMFSKGNYKDLDGIQRNGPVQFEKGEKE